MRDGLASSSSSSSSSPVYFGFFYKLGFSDFVAFRARHGGKESKPRLSFWAELHAPGRERRRRSHPRQGFAQKDANQDRPAREREGEGGKKGVQKSRKRKELSESGAEEELFRGRV